MSKTLIDMEYDRLNRLLGYRTTAFEIECAIDDLEAVLEGDDLSKGERDSAELQVWELESELDELFGEGELSNRIAEQVRIVNALCTQYGYEPAEHVKQLAKKLPEVREQVPA